MAGDPFTAAIFRWLDRVAADPELPPAAFRLGYIISQHINRGSLKAWPNQRTLADAIGLKDERQVRRLTDALERRGHVLTQRRKQNSMVYRLAQDRTELSYQAAVEEGPVSDVRPDENDRSNDQDRTFCAPRPDNSGTQDRTEMSAKPLIEPLKEPEGEKARTQATLIPRNFSLSRETAAVALEKLGSSQAVDALLSRFVNHYRSVAGSRAIQRDWQARFLLWVDNEIAKPEARDVAGASAPSDAAYRDALMLHRRTKGVQWTRHRGLLGPAPGEPGCRVPELLLIEFGYSTGAAA